MLETSALESLYSGQIPLVINPANKPNICFQSVRFRGLFIPGR